ncbi:MAG TPA: HEPN domain-containing protein [bacterium]|nr:HEPN domain-containing protein [bacterium]
MGEAKSDLVKKWLVKAAHDLASAQKLASDPDSYLDTAIYHCQQAAEKAVKAFLVFNDKRFQKTHDVRELLKIASSFSEELLSLMEEAATLTPYAGLYRYPDENIEPDRDEFDHALAAARKIYDAVLALLPGVVNPARADKNNREV